MLAYLERPSVTVRLRGHLVHVLDSKIIHLKKKKKREKENKGRVRDNKLGLHTEFRPKSVKFLSLTSLTVIQNQMPGILI